MSTWGIGKAREKLGNSNVLCLKVSNIDVS